MGVCVRKCDAAVGLRRICGKCNGISESEIYKSRSNSALNCYVIFAQPHLGKRMKNIFSPSYDLNISEILVLKPWLILGSISGLVLSLYISRSLKIAKKSR